MNKPALSSICFRGGILSIAKVILPLPGALDSMKTPINWDPDITDYIANRLERFATITAV